MWNKKGALLLRLSPNGGGGFFIVESHFATLFSMWWQLCYVFLRMGRLFSQFKGLFCSFFSHVEAFLLRLSPDGGPFSPFKSLSATFFLYVKAFFLRFSCGGGGGGGGGFFYLLKAFLLLFFSMWECCFWFYGDPFWLAPPLPKFWRGLMPACPLTPMSSMQYNHSLMASCHFRDILKIVTKYFLIYIFGWLTIFKIRKRSKNNIF